MRRKLVDPFKTWQRWFAWYPVAVGGDTMVWWEWVERRCTMHAYDPIWEYRFIKD